MPQNPNSAPQDPKAEAANLISDAQKKIALLEGMADGPARNTLVGEIKDIKEKLEGVLKNKAASNTDTRNQLMLISSVLNSENTVASPAAPGKIKSAFETKSGELFENAQATIDHIKKLASGPARDEALEEIETIKQKIADLGKTGKTKQEAKLLVDNISQLKNDLLSGAPNGAMIARLNALGVLQKNIDKMSAQQADEFLKASTKKAMDANYEEYEKSKALSNEPINPKLTKEMIEALVAVNASKRDIENIISMSEAEEYLVHAGGNIPGKWPGYEEALAELKRHNLSDDKIENLLSKGKHETERWLRLSKDNLPDEKYLADIKKELKGFGLSDVKIESLLSKGPDEVEHWLKLSRNAQLSPEETRLNHMTGLVDQYLALVNRKASPDEIKDFLINSLPASTASEKAKIAAAKKRDSREIQHNFLRNIIDGFPALKNKIPKALFDSLASAPKTKTSATEVQKELEKISPKNLNTIIEMLADNEMPIVVHGNTLPNDAPGSLRPDADIDSQMAAYILSVLAVDPTKKGKGRHNLVMFVPKGQETEKDSKGNWIGGIHLDTGRSYELYSLDAKKDKLLINHHFPGEGPKTSATELVYELLKKVSENPDPKSPNFKFLSEVKKNLEATPWLKSFIKFVNETDNLSYPQRGEKWFETNYSKTLVGLRQELPFETLIQFFKDKKDPYAPLSETELNKLIPNRGPGDPKKKITIRDLSEKVQSQVEQSIAGIREQCNKAVKNGLRLSTPELGTVLIYQRSEKEPNRIPLGAEAAYNFGFDTFVLRDYNTTGYFISSPKRNLSHVEGRFKQEDPNAQMIRATMLLSKTRRSKLGNRQFMSLLGLSMPRPEDIAGNVEYSIEKKVVQPIEAQKIKKQSVIFKQFIEGIEKLISARERENTHLEESMERMEDSDLDDSIKEAYLKGFEAQKEINDKSIELLKEKKKQAEKMKDKPKANIRDLIDKDLLVRGKKNEEDDESKKMSPEELLLSKEYPTYKTMSETEKNNFLIKEKKRLEGVLEQYTKAQGNQARAERKLKDVENNIERSNKADTLLAKIFG